MKNQARVLPLIVSCFAAPPSALPSAGCRRRRRFVCGFAALLLAAGAAASAQTAPSETDPTVESETSEELVELSPFVVEAGADADGYRANSTLAGTRVRTDLSDVASSISVVTAQFIKDTGATNNQTLLQYTTNTEVGGVMGNFAAVGGTFVEGAREGNFTNPNVNTRIRGLDSADSTRDYFLTDIPWDAFNVGRIDIQRGPNSILFGIGSPAGIINASVNTAGMKNAYEVQARVGSYGSFRASADFNQVIVPNQLAVRLAWVDDDTKYRQDPAYNHDKRLFAAMRYEPEFLRRGSARTTLRANYEYGDVDANRPRILPPIDQITPFFDSAALNRTVFDPYYAYSAGIVAATAPRSLPEPVNPWVTGSHLGQQFNAEPRFYYDALLSGTPAIQAIQKGPSGQSAVTRYSIGSNGEIDQTIGGYPFKGSGYGIATYNQFAIAANRENPELYRGAGSGFYKSYSLSDPAIFDFYNHLLDGPNKAESQQWDAFNITLEQTFLNNRLGLELVHDRQRYDDRGVSNGIGNAISVDINANTPDTLPWAYGYVTKYNGTGQAGTNANAGRAYVGSSSASGGSRETDRKNHRLTVFGELRAEDFMRKSLASDLIGRHVLTGLYSDETYDVETRSWVRYALSGEWDNLVGSGSGADGSGMSNIRSGSRLIPVTAYISDPLFSETSASGIHLTPIKTELSPSGSVNIRYFDSHWKWPMNPSDPTYVDPAAPWTNPTGVPTPVASTESENPVNYVGWKDGSFRILNADKGDIDSLYNGANKLRQKNTAEGLTWQGFLWSDTLVGTFGWRRDKQVQRSGTGQISAVTGAVDPDFELDPEESTVRGISRSWGVVLHQPKATRGKLPWGTKLSLTYSKGENSRVENRYAFDGSKLPNAKGETEDYGFMVSTLEDRLNLKVVWYETQVKDANISSTLSSESSLGATAAGVWQYTKWALGSAMQGLAGMAGDPAASSFSYLWNWAQIAEPTNTALADVNSDAFKNHPLTIQQKAAIKSFIETMPGQSFWDAYAIPVNVAAVKSGDYNNAIAGWKVSQGNWEIGGNQTINGVPPTGTVDNVSKGVEIELVGKLTPNWHVSMNASKQTASQVALGQKFVEFVEAQMAFYASPAGDMKLWFGGDERVGDVWDRSVGAAYRFQKETNGKLVPEMSPWRFNVATNYLFDRGILKGASLGGAFRWQDGQILGYALKPDFSNLDVNKPYWGESESALDLWVGYERKLTQRIRWRIQLNLRNVGDSVSLVPISVQPDGTPALQRIREGQTWTLTNTFSF
jgi:outer membrane receptor protein involved in Fe transport